MANRLCHGKPRGAGTLEELAEKLWVRPPSGEQNHASATQVVPVLTEHSCRSNSKEILGLGVARLLIRWKETVKLKVILRRKNTICFSFW